MILSMLVSTMAVDGDDTLIALALLEEDPRLYSASTILFVGLINNILVVGCCLLIQTMSPSTSISLAYFLNETTRRRGMFDIQK